MRFFFVVVLALVLSSVSAEVAKAQLTNENPAGLGNVSGQTGTSENFSIQRNNSSFIGGSATNIIAGQSAVTGTGGLGGLGTAGLIGGLGGLGRGFGNTGFGNTGFGNQNGQNTATPQIRFRTTLGFTHPHPAPTQISTNFSQRLSRIPQLPSAQSIAVTMEDRTAVLAGQVDSEREKRRIEKLAM
ncbi:MAG TPA: hypothetical protein P5307_26155, partial [Pirellulaceae bacterium]|nr:hypothetical protein [Pirellulaceae bacterium]